MYLRGNGIIKNHVHASIMDLGDSISPSLNCAEVLVEQGSIEGRVPIGPPGLIHQD